MPHRSPQRTAALSIVLLAVAAYANSLFGGFVYDDFPIIVDNPLIKNLRNLPLLFSTSYWELQTGAGQVDLNYYRPLTMVSFAFNTFLSGQQPFGFHVVNVALHVLVSLLIFSVFSKMGFSLRVSALSAFFFAVLPIHTEAVSGIVGRAEILVGFFLLLAWRSELGTRSRVRTAAGLGCFLLALLSKESAAVFPFILMLSDWAVSPLSFRQTVKKRALVWALYFTMLGFYFEWRWLILDTVFPVTASPYFTTQSVAVRFLTVARFFFEGYLWPMITGLGLTADYIRPSYPDARPFDAVAVVALAAMALMAAGAAVLFIRRKNKAAFAALFFLAFYVPISNFFLNIAYVVGAERFMYAAAIGFCLLAALLSEKALARWPRAAVLLIAGVLTWWTFLTARRNGDWKDQASFAKALVRDNERSPNGWNGLGTVYEDQGLPSEARRCYAKALELNPSMTAPIYNMASSYFHEKKYSEAREWFLRCTSGNTLQKDALTSLALIEIERKDYRQAFAYLNQAVQAYPFDPAVRRNLAIFLQTNSRKTRSQN